MSKSAGTSRRRTNNLITNHKDNNAIKGGFKMARGNDILYELPEEWRGPRGYGDYRISQKTLDEAGFYITMDWHYVDTTAGNAVRAVGPYTGRTYTVKVGPIPDGSAGADIDGISTRAMYRFWDLIVDCEKRETKSTWNGIAPEVYQNDYENIIRKSQSKSQPATKSFNDMVKEQRNKNVRKTYPEDLTDEQAQTFEGYRLWANSIGDEIWEVVRSVTGMRSRCDMELDNLWKEVSDLLIQAKEKADALANIGIELN